MDPNFGTTYQWLVKSLEMRGNYDEAFDWFMKAQALEKSDAETIQLFKTAFQTSGWQGVLRAQAERFDEANAPLWFRRVFECPNREQG